VIVVWFNAGVGEPLVAAKAADGELVTELAAASRVLDSLALEPGQLGEVEPGEGGSIDIGGSVLQLGAGDVAVLVAVTPEGPRAKLDICKPPTVSQLIVGSVLLDEMARGQLRERLQANDRAQGREALRGKLLRMRPDLKES
jgi:hypothetical protein